MKLSFFTIKNAPRGVKLATWSTSDLKIADWVVWALISFIALRN